MTGLTSAIVAAILSLLAPAGEAPARAGDPPPKGDIEKGPEPRGAMPPKGTPPGNPTTPGQTTAPGQTAAPPAPPVVFKQTDAGAWSLERHLQVADQPTSTEMKKLGDEAYRFIFTDSGLTGSKIVLVYRDGVNYHLKAADVHLHDYYGSGGKSGVEKTERKLTAEEWNALEAKLKKLDFWNYEPPVEPLGLDGTNWTLEGATGSKHLTTKIWEPKAGPFRSTGLHLWKLSGMFMGNYGNQK